MKILITKHDIDNYLSDNFRSRHKLALVPTMGALHEGHISLVKRALKENSKVVVSIFINPTQFNDPKDLTTYPQDLRKDLRILEEIDPGIIVFAPEESVMYPDGTEKSEYDLKGLDTVMEGKFRKGHFQGVCTVVERLFSLIRPQKAYFGEKDYQQLQIIMQMVKNRKIPVSIVPCPIVREDSGLAKSSRNSKLSESQRVKSALIFETLKSAKVIFGTKSAGYVSEWVRIKFGENPEFKLEYFTIADETKLKPIQRKRMGKKYRAFIAVYIGGVRLIDNIALY